MGSHWGPKHRSVVTATGQDQPQSRWCVDGLELEGSRWAARRFCCHPREAMALGSAIAFDVEWKMSRHVLPLGSGTDMIFPSALEIVHEGPRKIKDDFCSFVLRNCDNDTSTYCDEKDGGWSLKRTQLSSSPSV